MEFVSPSDLSGLNGAGGMGAYTETYNNSYPLGYEYYPSGQAQWTAPSSMVEMPFGSDVKVGIEELCPVCGDKVSGYHYGLQTCESCKGFFKRTVQNKKVYSCVDNRSCHIDKTQRKRCPYCRFQKCLNVGMKLEAVRTDRMRGGRNKFGPMYKRDRALKQQAIRQRQHMITQCQMSLTNLPPGVQSLDGSPDIKPNIAVLMSGPLSPVTPHSGMMHGAMMAPPGSSSPESPLTTDGALSISMSVSMTTAMAPHSMPSNQNSYYSPQSSYPMGPMLPAMTQSRHPQEQQEQHEQQQQQNDRQQPLHSHHHHHHHHSQHLTHEQQHQQHHPQHYQQQLQQQQHHHPHPHHHPMHHHTHDTNNHTQPQQQQHHQQQQQQQHSPLGSLPQHGGPPIQMQSLTPELPAIIKSLRSSLGHEEDRQKKLIIDEQIMMLQQQGLLGHHDDNVMETLNGMTNGMTDVMRDVLQVMCKLCDQSLFLLVEWARSACFFKDLRVEDQMKLLQNCWSELLILDFIRTQMKHDKVDQILLASGHMVSINLLNRAGLLECRERIQDLVRKFRELEADDNEFVCLKFLILLNPDVCGLLNRHHVEQIQEKINTALLEYCSTFQSHIVDKFGQLLIRLPEIRLMSLRTEEYLYFRHLYGDVQEQTLLVEMLHAKRK